MTRRFRTPSGKFVEARRPRRLDWMAPRTARPSPDTVPQSPDSGAEPGASHQAQTLQAAILERIKGTEICVFGAGSVSSWTCLFLAPYGPTITVFDMDTVTESNIQAGRTLYTDADIDRFKVDALSQFIQSRYPGTEVHPFRHNLAELPDGQIARLAEQSAVVLALIDDPTQLQRIADISYSRTYTVFGGFHRGGRSGHVGYTGLGLSCFRCVMGLNGGQREIQPLHAEVALACDIQRIAQWIAMVSFDLIRACVLGQRFGRWDVDRNLLFITNYTHELTPDGPGVIYDATRDPNCPVCGNL